MNPDLGGVCQGIRNAIPPMLALGCEHEVVCLDEPDETYGVDDPFAVHRIGGRSGAWSRSKFLLPWLREHLRRFDAVVVNGLWQYQSLAVTKAIGELRRQPTQQVPRLFVMPHGMLDPWFQRDPSRRLKAIRNWFVWKAVERRTIESADGVLFTCQRELELARETFSPYRPRAEINVGYGVPTPPVRTPAMDTAFRESVPELGSRPYLLFLSRIHPKKGVDLLLRAYAEVLTRSSSPPAPLPQGGEGSRVGVVEEPGASARRLMGLEAGGGEGSRVGVAEEPGASARRLMGLESGGGEGRQVDVVEEPGASARRLMGLESGGGEARQVGVAEEPGASARRLMGDGKVLPAMVIAGPVDSDYARRMQALAAELGLGDVFFPGMLSGDAKWGAFYGCEAFVLPSHQENFGIAVVEAMACGKPVLISDQVNICREIETAGGGIVRPDTFEGTLSLLQDFLPLSVEDRVKMGFAAQTGYATHFSIQQAATKMLQAISSH